MDRQSCAGARNPASFTDLIDARFGRGGLLPAARTIASVEATAPASPLKPGWVVGLVVVYFVAAKVGLLFAAISPSASAVWPPTGIAFAACLVLGLRVWPAIFVGAFLANATTAGSVVTSLGIAAGNTLEAVVGASLIIRLAHGVRVFESVRGIFAFVAVAALGSTTISATIGVASLLLGGLLSGADAARIWLTWWLGDATGNLIVAPLLVLWAKNRSIAWSRDRLPEAVAVLGSLVLLGVVAFGRSLPAGSFPLSFLCLPPLLWAAFRFGARATATATVLMSAMAVWGHARTIGSLSPEQAEYGAGPPAGAHGDDLDHRAHRGGAGVGAPTGGPRPSAPRGNRGIFGRRDHQHDGRWRHHIVESCRRATVRMEFRRGGRPSHHAGRSGAPPRGRRRDSESRSTW